MATENTSTTTSKTERAPQSAVTEDQTQAMGEVFGEVISSYSRAQAIEDGMLVDLSGAEAIREDVAEVCRQHYKWPVACTAAVFDVMCAAVLNTRWCNDYPGIVHDMLWMSKANKRQLSESAVLFRMIIQGAGRQKYHTFKLVVGPGDQGEPVITIMMPGED